MIILALICVPICGVLLAAENLLLLGGQTAEVAAMTAAYVRLVTLSAHLAHPQSSAAWLWFGQLQRQSHSLTATVLPLSEMCFVQWQDKTHHAKVVPSV